MDNPCRCTTTSPSRSVCNREKEKSSMDPNSNFSLIGMWTSMNWVAKGVVVVLAIMSIWSLTIAIERLIRFQRAKKESLTLAREVTPLLQKHDLDGAVTKTRDKRFRHSHLGR